MRSGSESENQTYDASVDLGDLGCGDLVLAINEVMQRLGAGEVLRVRALDPGARIDIPAWCRMRGHALLTEPAAGSGEFYYIRKGESR